MNPDNEDQKETVDEEQKSHIKSPVRAKRDTKRLTVIQKEIPTGQEEKDVETNSTPGVLTIIIQIPIQFAGKSKAGNVDGKHKTNQDTLVSISKFANKDDYHLFGVFDGHGIYGHYVSKFVSEAIIMKEFLDNEIKENTISIEKCLRNAFLKANKALGESKIDTNMSGTTGVVVLIVGEKIYCANVGDSRALLIKNNGGDWACQQLSEDHKPELEKERNRILEYGGVVEQSNDDEYGLGGPYRVWLKNEKLPGLAMSRSIGDKIATRVGVIADPDITVTDIKSDSKYIVLGSDGLWDVVTNEEVADVVEFHYRKKDISGALNRLMIVAKQYWMGSNLSDDITCIIVFLN